MVVLEAAAYLTIISLLSASVSAAAELSTGAVRATVGTILAVNMDSRSMLINVPLEKRSLKLGGSIATDAALFSRVCGADISDFSPGDRVSVRWVPTFQGPKFIYISSVDRPVILVNIQLKTIPGLADIYLNRCILGRSEKDGRYVTYGYWSIGQHSLQVFHHDYLLWEKAYMITNDAQDITDTAVLKKK
jgi:hypothetical protein